MLVIYLKYNFNLVGEGLSMGERNYLVIAEKV